MDNKPSNLTHQPQMTLHDMASLRMAVKLFSQGHSMDFSIESGNLFADKWIHERDEWPHG